MKLKKEAFGFTLIEVLISVLILGIGILGILSLQTRALMDNQDAYLRTQAIFLTYDMSDRIRANSRVWKDAIDPDTISTIVNNPATGNPTGQYSFCSAYDPDVDQSVAVADPIVDPTGCSEMQMAQYDVYRWTTDVASILNGATATLVSSTDVNTSSPTKEIIKLTISWSRVSQDAQNKLGQATYSLDVRL